jgi:branched-chain amino acid aminotransferase
MQTETISIQDYEPADQPYFERLYREWFTAHFGVPPEPIDERVLRQPEKMILEKNGAILMLVCDGGPAGFIALKKTDSYSYELTKMAVQEEFRGKGWGEALCRAAIDKARDLGAKRLILYSHSSLQAALRLYRKLGFVEIPLEPGPYSSFRCDIKMEQWIDGAHSRIHEVDWDNLELGAYTSDHMLVCDYSGGQWKTPEILPFGPFSLSPTTLALHYGQTIFEGMKAFRTEDGRIHIFRPDRHYERLVRSAKRLCMPTPSAGLFREGLRRLVELDKEWVPGQPGTALYLRPMIFATDTRLTVKVSDSYRFAVICLPAGPYFARPLRIKIEREFVRAVRGGTGYAKCGGNYGGALYPTQQAKAAGYDQVLWTDGLQHKKIEEMGMMNVFFVIDGVLITPPLTDTILDGVTRDSLLTLALDAGLTVEERSVTVEELREGLERKRVREVFGAGTAAVISPIGSIGIDGIDYPLPVVEAGGEAATGGEGDSISLFLKNELDAIRYGRKTDPYGWNDYI